MSENAKPATTKSDKLKKQISFFGSDAYKPERKYPSFWMNFNEYFSEYTSATSLHALQYIGEQKRSIFERIWWLAVVSLSLYGCVALIIKTYDKWSNTPVIVSFAQSPTPIYKIPFPAVTICSETKAKQSLFNYTEYFHKVRMEGGVNVTFEEKRKFQDISLLCDPHLYPWGDNRTNVTVIDFMSKVAPTFSEALWQCRWTNVNVSCDSMFTSSLTDEGLCFTANMLDRKEIYRNEVFLNEGFMGHGRDSFGWTLDGGYKPTVGMNTYPRRAVSAGAKAGMTILLRAYKQDLDYICKGPVQGFKVSLHHPGEVPRVSMQYFRVPLGQEVVVAIKPDMMTTSRGLESYDPKRRGCFFSKEKQLRFYQTYTQQNCEVECLANFTLELCKCVAYHMPHVEDTPICGSGSIDCVQEAQVKLVSGKIENPEYLDFDPPDCGCLPACTSLTYNSESSQANFNWTQYFVALKENVSDSRGIAMARIQLYFKELQFITSERNELYGLTDFMANCGGLLGLFIGFSFLSLVEILYFLSIRLGVNFKRHGKHYWSASEDLLTNDAYEHPNST